MHISTNSGENNASNTFENPENLEFTKILEIEENSENDQSSWMSWMSWSSFSHHEQVSRIKLELETNLQKKFSTILGKINKKFPQFTANFFLVSCEKLCCKPNMDLLIFSTS